MLYKSTCNSTIINVNIIFSYLIQFMMIALMLNFLWGWLNALLYLLENFIVNCIPQHIPSPHRPRNFWGWLHHRPVQTFQASPFLLFCHLPSHLSRWQGWQTGDTKHDISHQFTNETSRCSVRARSPLRPQTALPRVGEQRSPARAPVINLYFTEKLCDSVNPWAGNCPA